MCKIDYVYLIKVDIDVGSDSVWSSGDIITNNIVNNDPKQILEMFFQFQERLENLKSVNRVTEKKSLEIEIESSCFQDVMENYLKAGIDKFGIYFNDSNFYCMGIDVGHVMMLTASSDSENIVSPRFDGNGIPLDIPIFQQIFHPNLVGSVRLSRDEKTFSVEQNDTLFRRKIENFKTPIVPNLDFETPLLLMKSTDMINAISKNKHQSDSSLISFHLDLNGNLFLGFSDMQSTRDIDWHFFENYSINPDELKAPVQAMFNLNLLRKIFDHAFEVNMHIQLKTNWPIGFCFNKFDCDFAGFLAPYNHT